MIVSLIDRKELVFLQNKITCLPLKPVGGMLVCEPNTTFSARPRDLHSPRSGTAVNFDGKF
jgi:hypothetical protein